MEKYRLQKFERRQYHDYRYEVLAGNASLNEARVVVIAETHYKATKQQSRFLHRDYVEVTWSDSREKVQDFLAHYTKAGDVLLRESYQSGKEYSWQKAHNEFGIAEAVQTFGWDDMRLVRECRKWNRRARKARHLENDDRKAEQFDRRAHESAMQRNASMHRTIVDMEKRLREGGKVYLVAGAAHIKDNLALLNILHNYSYVVIEAKTDQDMRQTSLQTFP